MGEKPVRSVGTAKYDALSALVGELRSEAGLTQEQVASRLGQHFTWISKIERGTRRMDVVEMCDIAEAMGIDPVEFLRRYLKVIK